MCYKSSGSINIVNYSNPEYPRQPKVDLNCSVNQIYKTIPENAQWQVVASSPSTMKHLYTGIPNHYPISYTASPVNSLYGCDLSQFEMVGAYPKRMSYHYKVYPFTHRHARELKHYSECILPYMDNSEWVKYPIKTDQSLNLPHESIFPTD